MTDENPLLRVEELSCYFSSGKNTVKAVDRVSFDIGKGEVFGLVGESGCGKTTMGRTVIGLYKPIGGRVYFDGRLICCAGSDDTKDRVTRRGRGVMTDIQMIFQDPISSLDPRMTVGDIIAEGLIIAGNTDRTEIRRTVSEYLMRVGLHPEYASRYPHEFSGGQRQRIGIARALIMNPKLIIADEPVSALDVSVQAQIIGLLARLRKEIGLSVLFIAHDLSVVKYFCDRIGVMYKGRIVESAPSAELFSNPMHPYTRSLLSAVPHPDPIFEKNRKRIPYTASDDDTDDGRSALREIASGHFVYCREDEMKNIRTVQDE